jgi:hypothetical protein
MKIIISHDIDNTSWNEHVFDGIVIREIKRFFSEFFRRKIGFKLLVKRIMGIFDSHSWNNISDLFKFDKQNHISSTVFVAVSRGRGINYSQKKAKAIIDLARKCGFDVGLHGVCFDNFEKMKKEKSDFEKLSGLKDFGFRMHRLKTISDTFGNLEKLGYLFDSSIFSPELKQAHQIEGLQEFPFHVMDSRLLGWRSNLSFNEAKNDIISLLDKAEKEKMEYVSILFHNRRFGPYFPDTKRLYIWFIGYCNGRGYKFENYRNLL